MTNNTSIKNFEQNLEELESLVETLESGELSLEDALNHFEQGIKKTQACQKALHAAEQRVQVLVEKNGALGYEAFDTETNQTDG